MDPTEDPSEGYEDYFEYLEYLTEMERMKASALEMESTMANEVYFREQETLQKKLDEALAQRNAELEEIEQRRRLMANPNWGSF